MDFVFDLLQGAGIAAAIGIRPLLPVLLVGALASADLGLDFDGTDLSFLEAPGFLLAVVVLVAVTDLVRRRAGDEALEAGPGFATFAAVTLALGALAAAGSMADRDHPVIAGVIAGVAAAALGLWATRSLFARVRSRLDAATAGYLPLYREALAILAAALSVLFPPLAVLVIAALAWLLLGGQRREGEKYAGLRILR
jgi:Na+-translocating ferredoxin:NAD+ oxidoreductase RnfA subunit